MANSYVLVQDKVMTLVNEAEAGEHKCEQSDSCQCHDLRAAKPTLH